MGKGPSTSDTVSLLGGGALLNTAQGIEFGEFSKSVEDLKRSERCGQIGVGSKTSKREIAATRIWRS
jgi:hypothetical protein